MAKFEPRQLPDDTTEITYTGKGGRQVAVRITHGKAGTRAHPQSIDDMRALDALFPSVEETEAAAADQVENIQEAADTNTPAIGEQEG